MNSRSLLHRPEPTPDLDPDPALPEHDDPVDPPVPARRKATRRRGRRRYGCRAGAAHRSRPRAH